ncbi:MAG: hypothetical protein GY751_12710 [Bacteroidetes bacterium]|nr:hypothetical protein [Bacteroidota bacterium]
MKWLAHTRLKHLVSIMLIPFLGFLSACNDDEALQVLTDSRDGQTYTIVTIGNQTWMEENLNFDPQAGNYWCFDDDPGNCDVYGRLYDWNTAINIAPDGWHLPSDIEWQELIDHLGGSLIAGGKMKETGIEHWDAPNTGADNSSGFTARAGGNYSTNTMGFYDFGSNGLWWSSTAHNTDIAWLRVLYADGTNVLRATFEKDYAVSVRCIKD